MKKGKMQDRLAALEAELQEEIAVRRFYQKLATQRLIEMEKLYGRLNGRDGSGSRSALELQVQRLFNDRPEQRTERGYCVFNGRINLSGTCFYDGNDQSQIAFRGVGSEPKKDELNAKTP